jgi:diguanylate cyclase (GGDEF)-like protein
LIFIIASERLFEGLSSGLIRIVRKESKAKILEKIMLWIIPSTIMAASSALMVTAVFLYLYHQYHEHYIIFWAFTSFGFTLGPIFTLLSATLLPDGMEILGEEFAYLISSVLLIKGIYIFLNRKFPKWVYYGFILTGFWIGLGCFGEFSFILDTVPVFSFIAMVFLQAGLVLFRNWKFAGTAGLVVGWSLVIGSLNLLSYPFVRHDPWFGSWGYLLAAIYTMAIAIGILLLYFQKVRQDLSESEARYRFISMRDSLTGLYNRTFFEQECQRFDTEQSNPLGLILCDVDGLKLINDTFGHDAGNSLLLKAARAIQESFGENDMVARIGGDEFAILLPKTSNVLIEKAVKQIEATVQRDNALEPGPHLSISIGFSLRNDSTISITDLFKNADNNMYREKLYRSQSARSTIVNTLRKALEARDFITEGHTERLQDLVIILATDIGFPESRLTDLRLLAQFHDIGKVGIPDRILFKRGKLTPSEIVEMQRHCEIGYRIAQASPDLVPIADWILRHHEWWNGAGYPLKLKGEEIPLECRIFAIVDAFDAMTNNRPYRKALSGEEAVNQLIKAAGIQFDPHLVEEFIRMIKPSFIMPPRKISAPDW